jgi:hypothetical protein
MNDRIKQLLATAEQSDAISKNKWRIENREQLRKERKEKLKELMEKDKQHTAVDLFAEKTFNLIELMKRKWVNQEEFLDGILKARNEAKEIEKKRIIKAWKAGDGKYDKVADKLAEQYYNETTEVKNEIS